MPLSANCRSQSTTDPIRRAQVQITAYLSQLSDLHCTETVTQEKLGESGHVEHSARAEFDYLIMMGGNDEEFQLNESRIESAASRDKQSQLPYSSRMASRLYCWSSIPTIAMGLSFQSSRMKWLMAGQSSRFISRIFRGVARLPPSLFVAAPIRSTCKVPRGWTA